MIYDKAKLYFEYIILYCNKPCRVIDSDKWIRCMMIHHPFGQLCVFEMSTSGSSKNLSVYYNNMIKKFVWS